MPVSAQRMTPVSAQSIRGTMPKMKTRRGAAKRFKLTGAGRVRRPKCGGQHGMIGKSRTRRRRLRDNGLVSPAFERRIKLLLPYL